MSVPRLAPAEIQLTAEMLAITELDRSEAQQKPVAVLIVGQVGAGNASLASDICERLERHGGFVSIEAESLRTRLPYYEDLATGEVDVAKATKADTDRLADAMRKIAIEGSRNVIIEGGSITPDNALQVTSELRRAGYQVELHALAVNDQISYERATMRYEKDLETGSPAHYVPQLAHDQSFRAASDTVRRLEFAGAVDHITVYNRLNDAIVDQVPEAGRVVAGEAFDHARGQLTNYERINLAEKWDEIAEGMERRGASSTELDRVQHRIERSHYALRSSPAAAESYDYHNPSEIPRSKDLADQYGSKLEHAFRQGQRDQAVNYPELQDAFAAQAAAGRFAEQRSTVPAERFNDAIQDRIAEGLRTGQQLHVQLGNTAAPTKENAAALAR